MLHIVPRFVGAAALVFIPMGACATAADKEQNRSFKVTLESRMEMATKSIKHQMDADSVIDYTWKRQGNERTLIFDSVLLKVREDGKQSMNTFMSRAKFANTKDDQTKEVLFEKAPDQLKKLLRDCFDAPVCKLQLDESGKEVKRTVVAGPGAKVLVENGVIANALLFHPPYMGGQKKWSAPAEITMGNGGFAKGELTYEVAGGKNGQAFKVSGTLSKDKYKLPDGPLTIENAKYLVSGQQNYDPAQREWVSGKLKIDVSFEMTDGDKSVASAKGTIVASFEALAPKK